MISLATALIFCLGEQDFVSVEETYSSSLAETPHAWVASSVYAHEILLLDPGASPLLIACYELNKAHFASAAADGIPSLLAAISDYLHTDVFTNQEEPRQAVNEVAATWGHFCVPLDAFIASHSGVCRHFVLMAAYILARLQSDLAIPEVRIIRHNLSTGKRHAWLRIGEWHFDPYWSLVADLADISHREFLFHVYGAVGIESYKKNGDLDHVADDSLLWGLESVGEKSR